MLLAMKSSGKKVVAGLGTLMVAVAISAVTPAQKAAEYAVIKTRNPFGLVDPPPPVVVKPDEGPKKEAEPPPNVELTGLFHNSRKGKTVAMFLVEKKKGDKKESFMWAVGEGGEGMKVLGINEADKTVKLSVRNVESTITFSEKKAAPAAAPAGGPTLPQGARTAGQPSRNPRAAGAAEPAMEAQQFESTRRGGLGRSTSSMSAVGGAMPARSANPQANGLNAVAPRTLRVPATQQETMTRPEQEFIIETTRIVNEELGVRTPPLPPTSLTPPDVLRRIVAPSTPQ